MEVILLEPVGKLGTIGSVVKVKDGYARNFLLPREKALRATPENKAYFEKERAKLEAKLAEKRKAAEAKAQELDGASVMLIRQAGEDGRLYGSVSTRDIANALHKEQNIEVHHQYLHLASPIKYIGIFTIEARLQGGVTASFRVNVARSESEAEEAYREGLVEEDENTPVEAVVTETAEATSGEGAMETTEESQAS